MMFVFTNKLKIDKLRRWGRLVGGGEKGVGEV